MRRKNKNRFIKAIGCILIVVALMAVIIPVSVPASAAVTSTYSVFLPLSQLGCLGFTYPDRDSDILKLWKNVTVSLDTTVRFNDLGFTVTAPVFLQDAMIDFAFWNASSAHGTLSDVTLRITKAKYDLLKDGTAANVSVSISFDGYSVNCKQGGTNGYNTYDITYTVSESFSGGVDSEENNTSDPVVDENATTPLDDLVDSITGDDSGDDELSLLDRIVKAFADLIAGRDLSIVEYFLIVMTTIIVIFVVGILLKLFGFFFR